MAKLPVALEPDQQIALWRDMVEEGGLVTAWVQRLGIAQALRREAVIPQDASQESRKLLNLLLDALSSQAPELLAWAVDGYFWHCWRQRFPKSAAGTETTAPQSEVMRARLMRLLRRTYGRAVDLRESYTASADVVQFKLLAKRSETQPWETLVTLERPRLKSARLAAYTEATEQAHRETLAKSASVAS